MGVSWTQLAMSYVVLGSNGWPPYQTHKEELGQS